MLKINYTKTHIEIYDQNKNDRVLINAGNAEFLDFARRAIDREHRMQQLRSSDRIERIKGLRGLHNLGLKEAVDLHDAIAAGIEGTLRQRDSDKISLGDVIRSAMGQQQ